MKKQNLDEVIPFRLPRRQKAALLRIARRSGRAASDLLRELVEKRIAQDEGAATKVTKATSAVADDGVGLPADDVDGGADAGAETDACAGAGVVGGGRNPGVFGAAA